MVEYVLRGNKTSCKCSREPGGSESNDEVPDSGLRQPKPKKKKTLQENRDEKIQTFMKELTMKHGSTYTAMQYRIWCEMMVGNLHSSLDDPPTSSMFVRAEKGEKPDKNKGNSSFLTEALTQAAVAMSTVLSPPRA